MVVDTSVMFILQDLKNKSTLTKYASENHSHILLNIGQDEARWLTDKTVITETQMADSFYKLNKYVNSNNAFINRPAP